MNDINQSGWSTSGDQSPMAGRDQYITYAAEDARTTDTKLERPKESWVTSTRVTVLSVISSIVTVGTFAWTVLHGMTAWAAEGGAAAEADRPGRIAGLVAQLWVPALIVAVLVVITVAAWRYTTARRKDWPVYPGRVSFRRALVPAASGDGRFVRVNAKAECKECRNDNRPGIYGKLYRARDDTGGRVTYRCKNNHVTKFRGRSLFVG